jgi:hypothetical protein
MAGSYHFVVAMWRTKKAQLCGVKRSWETIADNLSKAGWSWGCLSAIDSKGRTIWIADAHRDDESVSLRIWMKAERVCRTRICDSGRIACQLHHLVIRFFAISQPVPQLPRR